MAAGVAEAGRFRGWIAGHFGLHFDDDKLKFLATLVAERAALAGISANAYLDALNDAAGADEWRPLVTALTTPETYFFRHVDQFEAFREVALPQGLASVGASGRVRILCAGCASGEEPYSLAMWMRERGIDVGRIAPIRAVDLNPAMLQKATAARYSSWALRETPPAARERWFAGEGRDFVLDATIRDAVTFEALNLAEPNPAWWSGRRFEVIFCRNVLMYFTRDAAVQAIARLAGALVPGGHLFMGHAETLRDLSDDFELCHSHDTFYYRRRARVGVPLPVPVPLPVASAKPLQAAYGGDLTTRVRSAWRLLEEERFADALVELGPLPAPAAANQVARLMRAALLVHAGRPAEAERECAVLLNANSHSAGAHYLLALCRDGAQDHHAAANHDGEAMALSPRFALPPLHLGLMARRAGDTAAAARYFDAARELLQTEESERLLLFGGGFSRAALVSLCGERRGGTRRRLLR